MVASRLYVVRERDRVKKGVGGEEEEAGRPVPEVRGLMSQLKQSERR